MQSQEGKATADAEDFRRDVTAEINGFQHRISHEVKGLAGAVSQSLQGALTKQESRIDNRFEEMKGLLQGLSGNRPTMRVAREAESERIED